MLPKGICSQRLGDTVCLLTCRAADPLDAQFFFLNQLSDVIKLSVDMFGTMLVPGNFATPILVLLSPPF